MSANSKGVVQSVLVVSILLVVGGVAAAVEPVLVNDGPQTEQGLLDCTGFDGYQQPLDSGNFNTARTSDEEASFFVSEDFVSAGGVVTPFSGGSTGLRWWGINFDFVSTFCTDDDLAGTPFTITFLDGDATGPGSIIATVTGVSPTITDTGVAFSSTTIKEYTATYSGVDITGATWVRIVRQTGVAGCYWLWVDEDLVGSYDDLAHQEGSATPILTTDHTMCLQYYDPTGPTPTPPPATAGEPVPSLNTYGIIAMVVLLVGVAVLVMWRRS
jgi:hypothetical protein